MPTTGFFHREDVKRVAVFRALQLGDMLCVVPALKALRSAFPAAHISLIGLPWAQSFAARYKTLIDEFVKFPGYPGLPEREPDFKALPDFFASMRARKFDLAIQMHGSGPVVNAVVQKMKPGRVLGYSSNEKDRGPEGIFPAWPREGHEIERYLSLLRAVGISSDDTSIDFPISKEDEAEFRQLISKNKIRIGSYICVHPGARLSSRRWPPERFAAVADSLADRFQIVITGSPEETELADAVQNSMEASPVNLCGQTTLGGVAALVKHARLLISNDTGISHLAAAFETRSVIVTLGSDPSRWAPLNRELHIPVFEAADCRPCGYEKCPIGHPCSERLEPERVREQALSHLERTSECVPSEF
jgi:ADP-heptose:LPS heptosyltransferase